MSLSGNFENKVVLVTGSSSGIGEATVLLFAKFGAKVVVTGRNASNIAKVAQQCSKCSPHGLKALEVVADLTKDEDCKKLIQKTIDTFGQIDILVNNAGAGAFSSISDQKIMDVYEHIMKTDLRSVVYLTHLAIPHLEKTKGVIINISSVAGLKPVSRYFVMQ